MVKYKIPTSILSLLLLLASTNYISAQGFETPRPSPKAVVSQTVGVTDITIHYSRPGVKERTIWGELVPYNEIWRTGANEVTSITFTDPVKIEGNELAAGTYGIHTIPAENEWTFIFSKAEIGGSSEFKEENEVLRIKAKPASTEFQERMIFTFTDVTDNSSMVNLIWEKLKVSFKVETNTQELVLQKANEAIDWWTPLQAATYCLQNNVEMEKAMNWVNVSTSINENYWNMRIKARILAETGKKDEAITTMEKALVYGKDMEDRPFDYDQMEKLLAEWKS